MATAPTLQAIDHIHDSDPAGAAEGLRSLVQRGIPADELPRFCWLVNHVIGEKLGAWGEARSILSSTVPASEDLRSLCHLAVAAHLAGDPLLAWQTADRLAAEAQVPAILSNSLIRLSTLQFVAAALDADSLTRTLATCVAQLSTETEFGELGKPIAGALNNVLSLLLEHPGVQPADATYRHTLLDGARVCRAIWQRAGNWLNDERANYLIALCANRVADWPTARLAAEGALATIAQNGEEDVDRAFILLELARALSALGEPAAAASARNTAQDLAQSFDADLRQWFDSKATA